MFEQFILLLGPSKAVCCNSIFLLNHRREMFYCSCKWLCLSNYYRSTVQGKEICFPLNAALSKYVVRRVPPSGECRGLMFYEITAIDGSTFR